MKLAFALFKYFPFGGVTRDLERLVSFGLNKGHDITVYALRWDGPPWSMSDIPAHCLRLPGCVRHQQYRRFGREVRAHIGPDVLLVGLNKMTDLDVYYAADGCLHEKYPPGSWEARWNPRTRGLLDLECRVFGRTGRRGPRLITFLSEAQKKIYESHYLDCPAKGIVLPPGIRSDCRQPKDFQPFRDALRASLQLAPHHHVILMVGSGFETKGVGRAIRMLGHLPADLLAETHLVIAGKDKTSPFQTQAAKAGLGDRVHFLGGREDVPALLWGADLLLHPAYHENAGMVILEALTAGLPVCVTRQCGYASFVAECVDQGAGEVWEEPLDEAQCALTISRFLMSKNLKRTWEANAPEWTARSDLYTLPERFFEALADTFG